MDNRRVSLLRPVVALFVLGGCGEIAARLGSGSSHVVVDDAHGIAVGNQVRVHGVNIGRITEIGLEPAGARISFELGSTEALHPDACGAVRREGLVGEAYLHIEAGTAEGAWQGPLRACETPSLEATIALTAGLLDDLRSYVGRLAPPSAAPPSAAPPSVGAPSAGASPPGPDLDAGASGLVDPWR
jgi:ABC-type transporter Mla subunit MlaD